MRLKYLITTAVAAGALSGAAIAQTAEPSQSTIPPTNDPTTFTDDQCGKHQGPRPCGAQVQEVPLPEPAPTAQTDLDSMAPAPAPMSDTSTTTLYQAPAMSPEVNTSLVTNGPVPDTPENRDRFGGPNSNAGRQTAPRGN